MYITFSKQQLLEKLEDPDIKRAFSKAVRPSSRQGEKIDKKELFRILISALDNHGTDVQGKTMRTINKREWRDLQRILRYVNLLPDARTHLEQFFEKRAKKFITNIIDSPKEKDWIRGLLQTSNSYPAKGLRLPDYGIVYDYAKFKAVAELIHDGFVTVAEYHYGGKGETEHLSDKARGSYATNKNWLYYQRGIRNCQSTIFHEATHVVQDWLNVKSTLGHMQIAAFLIQAVRIIKVQGADQLHGYLNMRVIKEPAKQLAGGKKASLTDKEYEAIKQELKDDGIKVDQQANYGDDKEAASEQILWKLFF